MKKIFFLGMFIIVALGISGCESDDLKKEVDRIKTINNNLVSKINLITNENRKQKNELEVLRKTKEKVNIDYAKAKVTFMEDHEKEFKAQKRVLREEKEKFQEERNRIKDNTFILSTLLAMGFCLLLIIGWLCRNKDEELNNFKNESSNYEKNLIQEKDICIEEQKKLQNKIFKLEHEVKNFEEKVNDISRNQVVSEIEILRDRRNKSKNSLGE